MRTLIVLVCLILSSELVSAAPTYQRVGGIPANELCDAGNVFKTLQPVTVCDSWQEIPARGSGEAIVPGDWICTASHETPLSIRKDITVCLKMRIDEAFSGCIEFGPGIQPSTVLAWERVPMMKDNLYYFDFTIPRCASDDSRASNRRR